jgi:hypothetical protein
MTSVARRFVYVILGGLMLGSTEVAHAEALTQSSATQTVQTYPHSRDGIEQQFAGILQVVRTGDKAAILSALDTLGIPDANGWISANFAAPDVAKEQMAYQDALKKFQSHVWWVTGNLGKNPAFALKVEESQVARSLTNTGFEGLIPRPKEPVQIETFRFTSTVNDPQFGQPSWVSSFIYLDGRFRMLGGTYPFWAEGLNGTRGPMSLPAKLINGRMVQAEAFRNDSKGRGIDAIVHIKIEVDHDGKLKKMQVLSGDPNFVPDAKLYLEEGEYPRLPDDPRLANSRMIWDMEVAFFTPQTSPTANP